MTNDKENDYASSLNSNPSLNDDQLALLNTNISELEINKRLQNFFINNKFKNFADIIHFYPNEITSKFSNVGRTTIEEIVELLHKSNLNLGFYLTDENKLSSIKVSDPERFKKIKNIIDTNSNRSFEEFNFDTLFDDTRHKKIFYDRLIGSKTLQQLANEFDVSRERVRQLETKCLKKIILEIGHQNFENNLKEFDEFFENSINLITKVDLLVNFKIFSGLQKFEFFHQLVSVLTSYFVKDKPYLKAIKYEIVENEIIFLTHVNNSKLKLLNKSLLENSYENVLKSLKKKYDELETSIKHNKEKLKLIFEDDLKSFGRKDLYSNLDKIIQEFEKDKSNNSFKVQKFFLNQQKLLSVKDAITKLRSTTEMDIQITDRSFGNYINDIEDIFEFERGKWGHIKNFFKINEENSSTIFKYIWPYMSANKFIQYNTETMVNHIKSDKYFIKELKDFNINHLDRFQLNIILRKSDKFNNELFYLGRDCWTLDGSNLKRKEIRYLIFEILEEEKNPIEVKTLMSKIEKQRQLVKNDENFFKNYIQTHCEGIDLINDSGLAKVIISSWNDKNQYKIHESGSNSLISSYHLFLKNKVEKFIKMNGHSDIKTTFIDEEGFPLGKRIYNFRFSYKYKKRELKENVVKLFDGIVGWTWENKFGRPKSLKPKSFSSSSNIIAKIKNFITSYGHSNIPTHYKDDDNFSLGLKIYQIKKSYVEGNLDDKISSDIENIEGWKWHTENINKRNIKITNLENLKIKLDSYYKKYNNFNISVNYKDETNYQLGQRVYQLNKKYKDGKLNQDDISFLENIQGWTWTNIKTREKKNTFIDFDTQIEFINKFKNEFGHLKAPFNQTIYGVNLSRIIARLREKYKKGSLPANVIEKINLIDGWTWVGHSANTKDFIIGSNLNEEKWFKFFKSLDDYLFENGDINFPVNYKVGDIRVGNILYNIRKEYKKNKDKLHSNLIKKLEAYEGWSWEHHKKTLFKYDEDKIISELKKYYNMHGNFNIKVTYEINNTKLGQVVYRYKRNYKLGKLNTNIIKKLEALEDWSW